VELRESRAPTRHKVETSTGQLHTPDRCADVLAAQRDESHANAVRSRDEMMHWRDRYKTLEAERDEARQELGEWALRAPIFIEERKQLRALTRRVAELEEALGMKGALLEVVDERISQDRQWGGPDHDDKHDAFDWCGYIRKQLTYVNTEATMQGGAITFRRRMIKVAALAIAGIQARDRMYEGEAERADRLAASQTPRKEG
jgi:hypothetical protein